MVYILDGYNRFMSKIFMPRSFERSYVTYLYFLAVTNVFSSHTFIYWWLRTFYVKPFSFLMVTNVSRLPPLFLDSFGCFRFKTFFLTITNVYRQNPCLLQRLRTFLRGKSLLIQRTAFFLPNPIIPLLFLYLLLAYNAIGSGLVTFQSVWHSNGIH